MTDIQPNLGRKIPPNNVGEDPVLIWLNYGLANLLFTIGDKFGAETIDQIMPWMDGLNSVVQDAVHEAKTRLRAKGKPYTPVGFRLDASALRPFRDDEHVTPTEGS